MSANLMTSAVFMVLVSFPYQEVQPQENAKQYVSVIEKFFATVQSSEYGTAVDFIYSDNPWIKLQSDAIQNLRTQFVALPDLLGKYIDNSLLIETEIGGRYVHLDYFVAFDRQPLRFSFQFYKPRDKWILYSFEFKDDLDDWLSETAKASYQFKKY